jgi:methyl-accepting chemotaxis protein
MNAIQNVVRSAFLIIAVDNQEFRTKQEQYIQSERALYKISLKELENIEKNEKGKALIENMKEAIVPLVVADNKAIKLALDGKSKEASEVLAQESEPKIMPLLNAVNAISAYYKEGVDADYKKTQATYKSAVILVCFLSVLSILIAIVCAVLITRSITRPLAQMRDMLQDIAQGEGDLTKRLDASSEDELGEVSRWFNTFVEKLQSLIGQIAQTSSQVADASKQLHISAREMSAGTEKVTTQASTVATASEEMSATSGNIAQNCSMAADGSKQASEAAVTGAMVVDETISVMNSIARRVTDTAKSVENLGSRSEQIGEIVGTIQDIADQTNLLALNAAIEAARAGEQGRGFAVVADEVRALAERTTKATKEISEMIKTIQKETSVAVVAMEEGVSEVAKGSEKAAESGKALERIQEQINDVTMQINQVATAAEEQTATTSEISNNMNQITEVVAQTSRGVHESAESANQLSSLAEELQRVVGQFKLA